MKRISIATCVLIVSAALFSCTSPKKIIYLQDVARDYAEKGQNYQSSIQSDDILDIVIYSKNPELTVPFNLYNPLSTSASYQKYYTVDASGFIEMPVLGRIDTKGITREQLIEKIKNELISGGYIEDPTVLIDFKNYKISVLGEVNRPGSYTITSERQTIFDALSLAGDLTIYGKRDRVNVIREVDGRREMVTLDLRSKDILNSPYYYVKQNDVVYVEPNKAKSGSSSYNSNLPLLISALSVLTTVVLFFFK